MNFTGTSADSVGISLPYVLPVQPSHDGFDSVEAAYLGRIYAGEHPHTATRRIMRTLDPSEFVPDDFRLERSHAAGSKREALCYVSADGSLAVQLSLAEGFAMVQVSGASRPAVASLIAKLDDLEVEDASDELRIAFWYDDPEGGARQSRAVQLPEWTAVQQNYPSATRLELDQLMALDRPSAPGRLLLWHGEPGTGKTTALTALSRAWEPWCDTHVITDPDRFFSDPNYLIRLLLGSPTRRTAAQDRWPLIVCEDVSAYLCGDGARRSEGTLGRLLGTTDGILGRGLNFVILLTTNEDWAAIDPAIKRPGRCLSAVEFVRFGRAEAAAWLGGSCKVPSEGMTLAELYERRQNPSDIAGTAPAVSTGLYL